MIIVHYHRSMPVGLLQANWPPARLVCSFRPRAAPSWAAWTVGKLGRQPCLSSACTLTSAPPGLVACCLAAHVRWPPEPCAPGSEQQRRLGNSIYVPQVFLLLRVLKFVQTNHGPWSIPNSSFLSPPAAASFAAPASRVPAPARSCATARMPYTLRATAAAPLLPGASCRRPHLAKVPLVGHVFPSKMLSA